MTANNNFRLIACLSVLAPLGIASANDDASTVLKQAAAAKQRAVHERQRAVDRQKRVQIKMVFSPDEMLLKSMQAAHAVNVVAIITKLGDANSAFQQLKLEQKAMGDQFRQVLQPLGEQGITYLDSGKKSFMYLPDQRVVFEVESQAEDMEALAQRAELAAKNYELRCEAAAQQVAGRQTFCVVAEPKVKGIPARQFYLDQQTLYPLRFAFSTNDGDWKISMDTQAVDFPKDMPQKFYFDPVGNARKVRFDPAQPLSSVRNVKDRLGFDPLLPKKLPYGFQIQKSELRRNEDGNLAVLWLTDGLASARVYEFRCTQMREGIWSRGNSTVLTEDGVTMYMVSDLAPSIRKALLSSFAHRTPFTIAPPDPSSSVGFGVKPPPVPSEEPKGAQQLFTPPEPFGPVPTPQPLPVINAGPVAIGKTNDVKGDRE